MEGRDFIDGFGEPISRGLYRKGGDRKFVYLFDRSGHGRKGLRSSSTDFLNVSRVSVHPPVFDSIDVFRSDARSYIRLKDPDRLFRLLLMQWLL